MRIKIQLESQLISSLNPYENLALPIDDGACDHLFNIKIPDISFLSDSTHFFLLFGHSIAGWKNLHYLFAVLLFFLSTFS